MDELSIAAWTDSNNRANTSGKNIVFFYARQHLVDGKSKLMGRPVHEEKVHCVIIPPGEQGFKWDQEVRDIDKETYPQQWAAYLNKTQNKVTGIPIEHWPALSDTQKADFKAMNIPTVEHFAGLPDSIAARIMGFYDLRAKAIAYVEAGKNDQLLAEVRKAAAEENGALRERLESLEKMLADLQKPKSEKKAS
jgi:hypothetical protein